MTTTTETPRKKRAPLAADFMADLMSQVRRSDPDMFRAVDRLLQDTAGSRLTTNRWREQISPLELLVKPLGDDLENRRAAKTIYAGLHSIERNRFRSFLDETPVLIARYATTQEPISAVIDGHERVRLSMQYKLGGVPAEIRETYPLLNGVHFDLRGREIVRVADGAEGHVSFIPRPLDLDTAASLLNLRGATVSMTFFYA